MLFCFVQKLTVSSTLILVLVFLSINEKVLCNNNTVSEGEPPIKWTVCLLHVRRTTLPWGELQQLSVQLLLNSRLLLVQILRRQSDVSPVRVQDQTRVWRRQQLRGGGERRDDAGDAARSPVPSGGRSVRLDRGASGGHFTGRAHMSPVVYGMLEVRHAG